MCAKVKCANGEISVKLPVLHTYTCYYLGKTVKLWKRPFRQAVLVCKMVNIWNIPICTLETIMTKHQQSQTYDFDELYTMCKKVYKSQNYCFAQLQQSWKTAGKQTFMLAYSTALPTSKIWKLGSCTLGTYRNKCAARKCQVFFCCVFSRWFTSLTCWGSQLYVIGTWETYFTGIISITLGYEGLSKYGKIFTCFVLIQREYLYISLHYPSLPYLML